MDTDPLVEELAAGTSGFLRHARGTADGVRAEPAGCDVRTWRSRETT
jgi:hypothetical protein